MGKGIPPGCDKGAWRNKGYPKGTTKGKGKNKGKTQCYHCSGATPRLGAHRRSRSRSPTRKGRVWGKPTRSTPNVEEGQEHDNQGLGSLERRPHRHVETDSTGTSPKHPSSDHPFKLRLFVRYDLLSSDDTDAASLPRSSIESRPGWGAKS